MDQMEEPIQTEPQDLTMKRPRTEELLDEREENEHTVSTDTDGTTVVERRPSTDDPPKDDQTMVNSVPVSRPVTQAVIDLVSDQYEQKLFWDEVLEKSQNTDNLEAIREALTVDRLDVQQLIEAKDKSKPIANCDIELRHLLTKLKFVNQLYEGYIGKVKTQMSTFKMQDFDKE